VPGGRADREIGDIRGRHHIDVLGGTDVAAIADRDSADHHELDVIPDELGKEPAYGEFSHRDAGGRTPQT
jgi:hypothetical protein